MTRLRPVLLLCAAMLASVLVAGCGSSSPTPTHVTAVYADAISHGDFRAACQQIQPSVVKNLWGGQSSCEGYFSAAFGQMAAFYGLGGYRAVAHTYRGWREGDVRVATVLMTRPYGDVLRVRLVKTAHGWKIASVGQ